MNAFHLKEFFLLSVKNPILWFLLRAYIRVDPKIPSAGFVRAYSATSRPNTKTACRVVQDLSIECRMRCAC